jgi:hypothetical protein
MSRGPDKSADHPAHEKLKEVVHRYKQRNFCVAAVDNILDGESVDDALTHAVQDNFMAPYGNGYTGGALDKAKQLMQKPHIMLGMELLFDEAGLTMPAAIQKQVDLIRSLDENVAQRGLDRYFALTVPKATTKVEVRSVSVMEVFDRPSNAPMAARSLKKIHDEGKQ